MKKLLALVLALVMVLGVFGCVSAENEKRTLTIVSDEGRDWGFLFETAIFKKLAEKLNCEFVFNAYDADSFAAWLAGGDLADIIMCAEKIDVMLGSGYALNLDEVIDQIPNLKDGRVAATMQISRDMQSPDGNLYMLIPNIGIGDYQYGGAGDLSRGYVVYWDYYKELGCPEINNDDEYIAVLQQMLANHPVNEDGTPNLYYGVNPARAGLGGYRSAFLASVNVNGWANYEYKSDLFTNEVKDGYLDDNGRYIVDMQFANKLYRLGMIDEEVFATPFSEVLANAGQAKYMGMYWAAADGYVAIPTAATTQCFNGINLMGEAPGYYSIIWKDSPNKDLALEFFNTMYDVDFLRTCYSGEQGVTWDYDENGVPHMFEEAVAARAAGTDSYWGADKADSDEPGDGYGYVAHGLYGMSPATIHDDGYPLDLTFSKEVAITAMTPMQKDMAEAYGVEYYMEAYMNVTKDFRNDLGSAISACVTVSDDENRILNACEEVLSSGMADLILAESDEEFDEAWASIKEEIKDLGEEAIFAAYKVKWDELKDFMTPLLLDALEANGFTPYTVD